MNPATVRQVYEAARALFRDGDVVEVRVPKAGREKTISGYFSDFEKMAQAVARLDVHKYPGIYWTLNPVPPALLSRADHKTKPFAESTTSDGDILCRRLFGVDLDPKRPAGISSSEAEHAAALELAERIQSELLGEGWPAAILADSGNGAHLLYGVDLPNDDASADLLKRALLALAARFNTPVIEGSSAPLVEVDRTTFNASRIFKIYGTTARKGDHTADRPHRPSQILRIPEKLESIPLDLLNRMAAGAPEEARKPRPASGARYSGPGSSSFDLEAFLNRHSIQHRDPVSFQGGRKFVLECCPWDSSHRAPDSAVFDWPDGRLGFKCLHNSCAGHEWHHLREMFEPPRPALVPARSATLAPEDPGAGSDGGDKNFALSAADVEAAVDAAIAADDLEAALRLIPEIAGVPLQSRALIKAKLSKKFKRDFPKRDFDRAVKEASDKLNAPPPPEDDDEIQPGAPDLICYPLTDSGNAERLIALHGADLRFCTEFGKWLLWDGRRWKVDSANEVVQRCKAMARLLHYQAEREADGDIRKLFKAHARQSESKHAIEAMLKLAATEPGVPVSASDLDQHRYLLNCLNGVVDVRSGELLLFERRYLITKLCRVKYVPVAPCPQFMKFLHWTMGETPDMGEVPEKIARLIGYLQKSLGYALTADVSEKAAFVFYGKKGNNGKTTLLTVFQSILAEYSTQLDINTLMTAKFTDNNVRADLAKLHGARLVITSEVDDQAKLSERLLKYLTAGMGNITACRKFENPFEFPATHKIFMDCNYRPTVRGGDEAIWARLKCVPFLQHLDQDDPEIDKKLKDKILAESEGVLAWAIRGAMRWAKDGSLGEPPEIKQANVEWRDSDDPLKDFLEDCCEIGQAEDGYWVRGSELSTTYEQWCKDNREKYPLGRGQFTDRLDLKGFGQSRSRRNEQGKQMRTWEGLKLRDDVTLVSAPRGSRSGELKNF